ncbi:hypothetical protein L1987_54126 [Smallanthus sonchifolius]|uniref:Uncharacterized protein n=1 Tax=Smallanthus sonchifolius TaxID=185202 RepID=A0ACB9E5T7_9ASTR|nr:hypothetical protein L1987_54126 [Smallanthus sonchifolius]
MKQKWRWCWVLETEAAEAHIVTMAVAVDQIDEDDDVGGSRLKDERCEEEDRKDIADSEYEDFNYNLVQTTTKDIILKTLT